MSPRPLIQRIQEGLNGVSPRKKLIVAVSGGADSVAILHLLLDAGYRKLVVAHFNHRLRGKASAGDVVFVGKLATKLNLPFEDSSADVKAKAKEGKLSIETAARDARYGFLASVAKKHGTRAVILAHHSDDQVETCLFNFLRGTGMAGLAGMKPISRRRIGGITLTLHRPLLGTTKKELLGFLRERKIRFREDATNALADASRNKLRLRVLPLIEELLGPSFRTSIIRSATIFADEEDLLAGLAAPMAARTELPVKIMRELHPALRRRVIHGWLKNRDIPEPGVFEVELVSSLLAIDGPAKINLPGNHHGRRRSGVIFIE